MVIILMEVILFKSLILLSPLLSFTVNASDYSPSECPVVGNTKSHIFHIPGGTHYGKMLKQNKGEDNRECFKTEDEAKAAGYTKSKR